MNDTLTTGGKPPAAIDGQKPELPKTDPPLWRRLLDNPWLIMGLLVFVMGVSGLPLLWASRGFRWPAKIVFTLFVTLCTVGWVGLAYFGLAKACAEIHRFYHF